MRLPSWPMLQAKAAKRAVQVVLTRVRARFDSAETSDDNRRHWGQADALSAAAATSPRVRRTMRMRARYEVANNSYARGIVNTLANDTVGTGPRLQMQTSAPGINAIIEARFNEWAEAVGLAEILRTMLIAKVQDGEDFCLFTTNPRLSTPVKLDLKLIEGDQVQNPWDATAFLSMSDGIEYDEAGNPDFYHVLRHHPGDLFTMGSFVADRVPAKFVIHYFRTDRPGQQRGIPEIMPALPLFAQLRRYTLAVLQAAEQAAEQASVMKTTAPPEGAADLKSEPFQPIELERGQMTVLPEGWDAMQMKAEQPTTTYAEFKKEIINEIARCLNMPFNVAAGNSSGYNYASGRLDHQVYFKSLKVEQRRIERVVLERIFAAWFEEAVRIEPSAEFPRGYLPQFLRQGNPALDHLWFWDGQEHVDPQKEAEGQALRLANHTTTLAEEYAKRGKDWEVAIAQAAREAAVLKAAGLTMPYDNPLLPTSPKDTGVVKEQEVDDDA